MSDWKVGDRVQLEKGGMIRAGYIAAVATEQVERTKRDLYSRKESKVMETVIKSIDVQWDDGELQQGMSEYSVNKEDSEIERTFRLAVNDAQARIGAKLIEASKLIDEACAISEETGIPFRAGVSPLGQSYIPSSLSEKFPDLDREFATDIADAHGEYEGWQYSAVCY
jgi:hypothetical protein